MGTNVIAMHEILKFRNWRVNVKSKDSEHDIDFVETIGGNAIEAKKRARIMWARTSYQVNGRNLDAYVLLEVYDLQSFSWRKVWEHRGVYPDNLRAPAAT